MEAALYDSSGGYYASGKARVGTAGGDFYTSVSVGPAFAALVADQAGQMWEFLGCPQDFVFMEQGAHDGTFALDFLKAVAELGGAFAGALNYTILEPFPLARTIQVGRLQEVFPGAVTWWNELPATPVDGVFFSNELVDALPVHRVVRSDGRWMELFVVFVDGRFAVEPRPIPAGELGIWTARLPSGLPDGYQTEIHLDASRWMTATCSALGRGFVFLFDYGFREDDFYAPHRMAGTVACYRGHRRTDDPLDSPGSTDITAHVNFTGLARAAGEGGADAVVLSDQNHFLIGVARRRFASIESAPESPPNRAFLKNLNTLTHPGILGRSFHGLVIEKEVAPHPPLLGHTFTTSCETLFSRA